MEVQQHRGQANALTASAAAIGPTFSVSGDAWPAGGSNPIHLAAHFANKGGGFGANAWYTDQRLNLPADVGPGSSLTLTIAITAPSNTAGNLVLEYQMVKESQFWFGQFTDVNTTVAMSTAWVASYNVASTPTTWTTHQTQIYSVTLTNNGSQTWPVSGPNPVDLGVRFANIGGGFGANAWYTEQRFNLAADLVPGASVTLTIAVTSPTSTAGNLVLEYQMTTENQFWFAQFADVTVAVNP